MSNKTIASDWSGTVEDLINKFFDDQIELNYGIRLNWRHAGPVFCHQLGQQDTPAFMQIAPIIYEALKPIFPEDGSDIYYVVDPDFNQCAFVGVMQLWSAETQKWCAILQTPPYGGAGLLPQGFEYTQVIADELTVDAACNLTEPNSRLYQEFTDPPVFGPDAAYVLEYSLINVVYTITGRITYHTNFGIHAAGILLEGLTQGYGGEFKPSLLSAYIRDAFAVMGEDYIIRGPLTTQPFVWHNVVFSDATYADGELDPNQLVLTDTPTLGAVGVTSVVGSYPGMTTVGQHFSTFEGVDVPAPPNRGIATFTAAAVEGRVSVATWSIETRGGQDDLHPPYTYVFASQRNDVPLFHPGDRLTTVAAALEPWSDPAVVHTRDIAASDILDVTDPDNPGVTFDVHVRNILAQAYLPSSAPYRPTLVLVCTPYEVLFFESETGSMVTRGDLATIGQADPDAKVSVSFSGPVHHASGTDGVAFACYDFALIHVEGRTGTLRRLVRPSLVAPSQDVPVVSLPDDPGVYKPIPVLGEEPSDAPGTGFYAGGGQRYVTTNGDGMTPVQYTDVLGAHNGSPVPVGAFPTEGNLTVTGVERSSAGLIVDNSRRVHPTQLLYDLAGRAMLVTDVVGVAPVRLSQRNDGAGVNGSPRLRGLANNPTSAGASVRLAGANTYP